LAGCLRQNTKTRRTRKSRSWMDQTKEASWVSCFRVFRVPPPAQWIPALPRQRPAQEDRPDRKPGADRGEQHEIAALDALLADRVGEGERDRRGGGIAVHLEIDDDLRVGQSEALGGGGDDAAVRLVRHEQVDLRDADAVALEH